MTLIELMVGMLIGLISTLIITQVMTAAEGHKRATTAGSDAQVNGALSLFSIQRELQMAGYGLTTMRSALGCPVRGRFDGANFTSALVPVVITQGATAADPDTITVLSGTKTAAALPTQVTSAHPKTGTDFVVQNSVGLTAGDLVVAVPVSINNLNWCSLFNVTSVTVDADGKRRVAHAAGPAGPWNVDPASSIFPELGYAANSYLINAGQLVQRTYSVNAANRVLQESVSSTATGGVAGTPTDLFPEIVNLQALYGKDTTGDDVVDTFETRTPTTQVEWAQVRAIRVAVVARSAQFNQEKVTAANPQWDLGEDEAATVTIPDARECGTSRCIELSVNADADWQHYRYKVYDAVIPLRNIVWSQ